ncbi:MAG TPA: thioredoxin domain-containing protein [Polyangiaceae bacterium]
MIALLIVAGCNDPVKPGSGGRSEQVVSDNSAAASTATATVTASAHVAAAPKGPVCDKTVAGRVFPKSAPAFVDAAGAVSDRAMPAFDGHRARWVSFFASWCGPCKEEIPRVQSFASRLGADVAFVSIDDDLRQLTAFFGQQPDGGIKSSYWLKDGAPRTAWLASLKMKGDPPLPEHAIFDGKGKIRCFVSGAIEDADFGEIAASLK